MSQEPTASGATGGPPIEWNAKNMFTGWANPGLTAAGERNAVRAGHLLAAHGLLPDTVHTSLQRRAIHSADPVIAACDRDWVAVAIVPGLRPGTTVLVVSQATRSGRWSSTWTRSATTR